jgi:hypothetical protein
MMKKNMKMTGMASGDNKMRLQKQGQDVEKKSIKTWLKKNHKNMAKNRMLFVAQKEHQDLWIDPRFIARELRYGGDGGDHKRFAQLCSPSESVAMAHLTRGGRRGSLLARDCRTPWKELLPGGEYWSPGERKQRRKGWTPGKERPRR